MSNLNHYSVRTACLAFLLVATNIVFAQKIPPKHRLKMLKKQQEELKAQENELLKEIEWAKFSLIREDLNIVGLPKSSNASDEPLPVIFHSAMALAYAEQHEQPQWVAHIILPDILKGQVTRSNDFRPDALVKTGSAVEADYFLKTLLPDSTYEYDGFGFDRGHLAPSADFRWSQIALSESYFYSNMSPQRPNFNRKIWGSLESKMRAYIYAHPKVQLYVVTGPVLEDDLPVSQRSINGVTIPRKYWKVALDLDNRHAIGFIIPNKGTNYPLATFAVSVDKVEEITGLDFFSNLNDTLENRLESTLDKAAWLPEIVSGDVEPIYPPDLGRGQINTALAPNFFDKRIEVCGTVVSARRSRQGNILINLDKQFPNQVFTVFIREEHIVNFPYDPETEWEGQQICIKGVVQKLGSTPVMFIERASQIKAF